MYVHTVSTCRTQILRLSFGMLFLSLGLPPIHCADNAPCGALRIDSVGGSYRADVDGRAGARKKTVYRIPASHTTEFVVMTVTNTKARRWQTPHLAAANHHHSRV